MSNLFELNNNYRELQQMEEVDYETIKDTLEAIDEDRNTRLDNIAWLMEFNEDKANRLKDKSKEFSQEANRLTKKNKSLMRYMTEVIDDMGVKEVQTENHILKPRNYKASVDVEEEKLPKKYWKQKIKEEPDKTLLYELLKSGEDIPGATLKPNRKTVIK